jgi:hypothetical protein
VLSQAQADRLWAALVARGAGRAFTPTNVAYYLGGLTIIGAMSFYVARAWEGLGGGGIFLVALAYAATFAALGWRCWRRGPRVAGGILVTAAVATVPLAVYGLERALGLWPQGDPGAYQDFHVWVKGSWLVMELATIAAGTIALRFVRFPFLTAPIAFTLWYMSMDLTPLVVGRVEFTWDERMWVSLVFGAAMCMVAVLLDRRRRADVAFWIHVFGALAAWGGLSLMDGRGEVGRLVYGLVNLAAIALALRLDRRVYAVFGGIGLFGYLGHLTFRVFPDTLGFSLALTVLGLALIAIAVRYDGLRARRATGGAETSLPC